MTDAAGVGGGMRIAVFQGAGVSGDVAANLGVIRAQAERAAAAGARLIVFPELFTTGYEIGRRVLELAEPVDGPIMVELMAAARRAGIAILTGWPERAGDAIFNAAALIGRDGGLLANHRKLHLYGDGERALYRAGSAQTVVELDGCRVGILICYDVEFPEAVRALALAGAQLVAVPTALMQPYTAAARLLVPARAAENQLFVAYANRVGQEGELRYLGQSCVCDPDGRDLARAGASSETLLLVDLDLAAIGRSRAEQHYLRDRRPDLYGSLI